MKLISGKTIEATDGDTVEGVYRLDVKPAGDGPVVRCDVTLATSLSGAEASLTVISSGQQTTEDQALDVLAAALEAVAAALRARGEVRFSLPLYG